LGRRTKAALAVGIVLAVLVVIGRIVTAPNPFVPLVEEVVRTPQTYYGEHSDKLVALGADAVPAIGEVMLAGEKFFVRFCLDPRAVGDERGTGSIVTFVSRQTPYSDVDRSTLAAKSVLALRGTPNADACEPVAAFGTKLRTRGFDLLLLRLALDFVRARLGQTPRLSRIPSRRIDSLANEATPEI
jgi:hypothetical protein